MTLKTFKPYTKSTRGTILVDRTGLWKGKPFKSLLSPKNAMKGRNNNGHITSRNRAGGHKKMYRQVDFYRKKFDMSAVVERIEYDPNRSSHIALILYKDGERKYIISPKKLKQGDKLVSGEKAPLDIGNSLPLNNITVGTVVHCIEMKPGKGAQIARSAGTSAQLLAKEGNYATLRLKSGEVRKILITCRATIGEVGHSEHNLRKLGKAGAKRWRGVRPTVRGVAMNPVNHPHGGGEGKTSGGRDPVSPWGMPTKGFKTRSNKTTDKFIVRRRRKRK